ncbi:MAG: bifunctional diaminohydroxyphosphoribosylaminopyrimidine deaminase/5-amino-6-(5-phosphoribosylamino)uracil reductase RibD [Candidatus Omnitrophica bacterium]|nr:bifunctional diaminohydroxyphosphoribosylaminopyrimidine deaminase/5-amino-6-(5-phosphoribosylamino)uracil reductase RibD [Candidatus Omnitrophota bacterium]
MTHRTSSPHQQYMQRALDLARRAQGFTSPNPMVGAVIVKSGRVIAEGYHRRAGLPHAEVDALRRAGARARGATLYVTLEPCNHTGRTPPCCDAILAAGIRHVVVAMKDPNPITNGRGLARLRRAGVRVTIGVHEAQARALNAAFCKAMTTGLPFVTVKVGQSLDGKIATRTGESRWITSAASRRISHQLRSRHDAILVGINTVLRDDPLLTVRGMPHRADRPVKVIVDSRLRLPSDAACVSRQSPAPTLIATTAQTSEKADTLARRGAEVLAFPARRSRVPLRPLFQALVRRGIHSVLIEGGGEVIASAFEERLVDRVACFVAPLLIGGRLAPSAFGGKGIRRLADAIRLDEVVTCRSGPDLCVEARVVYPKGARGKRQGARKNRFSHAPRPTPHAPQVVF